ncbi:MAG: hypothetical protein GY856_10560 [bacterium]|nr:hypothetical protein [bacterium]
MRVAAVGAYGAAAALKAKWYLPFLQVTDDEHVTAAAIRVAASRMDQAGIDQFLHDLEGLEQKLNQAQRFRGEPYDAIGEVTYLKDLLTAAERHSDEAAIVQDLVRQTFFYPEALWLIDPGKYAVPSFVIHELARRKASSSQVEGALHQLFASSSERWRKHIAAVMMALGCELDRAEKAYNQTVPFPDKSSSSCRIVAVKRTQSIQNLDVLLDELVAAHRPAPEITLADTAIPPAELLQALDTAGGQTGGEARVRLILRRMKSRPSAEYRMPLTRIIRGADPTWYTKQFALLALAAVEPSSPLLEELIRGDDDQLRASAIFARATVTPGDKLRDLVSELREYGFSQGTDSPSDSSAHVVSQISNLLIPLLDTLERQPTCVARTAVLMKSPIYHSMSFEVRSDPRSDYVLKELLRIKSSDPEMFSDTGRLLLKFADSNRCPPEGLVCGVAAVVLRDFGYELDEKEASSLPPVVSHDPG